MLRYPQKIKICKHSKSEFPVMAFSYYLVVCGMPLARFSLQRVPPNIDLSSASKCTPLVNVVKGNIDNPISSWLRADHAEKFTED